MIKHYLIIIKELLKENPRRYSLTGQALNLLSTCHQFEFHKPQGHWRFTWPLTSRSMRLVKVRAS